MGVDGVKRNAISWRAREGGRRSKMATRQNHEAKIDVSVMHGEMVACGHRRGGKTDWRTGKRNRREQTEIMNGNDAGGT